MKRRMLRSMSNLDKPVDPMHAQMNSTNTKPIATERELTRQPSKVNELPDIVDTKNNTL